MTTNRSCDRARDEINAEVRIEAYVENHWMKSAWAPVCWTDLLELGVDVVGFNGGTQPVDKERFVNARAEAY
jgi:hypothetical protein